MDGWNMIVSFLGAKGLFSGAFAVSFREGNHLNQTCTGWWLQICFFPFHPDLFGEEEPVLTD